MADDTKEPAAENEPEPEKEPEQEAEPCVNCGEPSVVTTDGQTADAVSFCARHRPENV